MYHRNTAGGLARGVVGAHACGAVVVRAGERPAFHRLRTERLIVMGAGERQALAPVTGYRWAAHAVGSTHPEAPVQEFQRRMRTSEARLAETLSAEGWLTIVDGPLYNVRTLDEPVIGYVKTHLQRRLPARAARACALSSRAASARRSSSPARATPPTCGSRRQAPTPARGRGSSVSRCPSRAGSTTPNCSPTWSPAPSAGSRASPTRTRALRRTCCRSARSSPTCATASVPPIAPHARSACPSPHQLPVPTP